MLRCSQHDKTAGHSERSEESRVSEVYVSYEILHFVQKDANAECGEAERTKFSLNKVL